MDLKYGRIFTQSDVEKILEVINRDDAPDHWWEDGELKLDVALKDMDDMEYRFKWEADEPVFVLRARDATAEGAVRWYRDRQPRSAPANFLDGIDKAVTAFHQYRTDNPQLMKNPD